MEPSKDCVLVHSEGCSSFQQRVLRSSLDQVISDVGDLCDPVVEVSICILLHFALVVDHEKCIVVTRVCVSVCVCLSAAACPHYCKDPDITWGSGRGCPLFVHYWADLQSVHGLRCYGNTMEMRGRAQQ